METISEKLAQTVAEKNRIVSEVNAQSEKITAIKSDIYDILESDEIPKSFGAKLVDGSITEITAEDLDGITKISDYAFYRSVVTSIEIPDSVTIIAQYALGSCFSVTNVKLSTNLTTMGYGCLQGCSKLTNLTIPASVTSCSNISLRIGSSTNKATIRFLGTTPPTIATDTFDNYTLNQIIVPKGYGEVYKSATNWSNFADYIVEASE